MTNSAGTWISAIELDPWGADTNRSISSAFQPRKFTSYERDGNGSDEAMFRRYNRKHSRFDQPDPYDGSYSLTDPQSFNRYAYVQNDPVNFVDPIGLNMCSAEFSFAQCGGNEGFWGGSGGSSGGGGGGGFGDHVAEYDRDYGGMPASVAAALHLHSQRITNSLGGFGFRTSEEVLRGGATDASSVICFQGECWNAGGAAWIGPGRESVNFSAARVNNLELALPDYYQLEINIAIPNKLTLTAVGVSFTGTLDRNGNIYGGIGPSVGKSIPGVSGAATANYVIDGMARTVRNEDQLASFLSGHSITAGAGFVTGGHGTWAPGNGFAIGTGGYTPQIGAAYNYSWQLGNPFRAVGLMPRRTN